MAFTPRKSVQFAADDEVKEFVYGSPYSEASSTDSINATSTLTYINSQLVAHGFARGSGVSFEGLSKQDAERLSKCMLAILGQRAEDVSRVENITTKIRTLAYENERIAGMQRTAEEQAAAAERDTNLYKSRLSASAKALQACETAHKATGAEMQRTKSAMQSLRQTHIAEIKRKEKEIEKILDRWQKISDSQSKLGVSSSGIKYNSTLANPTSSLRGDDSARRGPDLLEDALEAAEISRKELSEENTSLKGVVLSTANELARILRACRVRATGIEEEEVAPFKQSEFFELAAPENAGEKMGELIGKFRQTVVGYGVNYDFGSTTPLDPPASTNEQGARRSEGVDQHGQSKELQRLQNTIVDLRRQLEQARTRTESGSYSNQAQEIVRKFVNDDNDKVNVHERQLLEKIRKELDHARKKVDEAALALRDEKALLEEEREQFAREQHLWRSQMAIPQTNDGPKPLSGLSAYFEAPAEPLEFPFSPHRGTKGKRPKSPQKGISSPKRAPVQHSPARSAFAVGKRSKKGRPGLTPKKPNNFLLGASTSNPKVIPPMETEVMPLPKLPSATSSNLIVPESFILPPPSPLASLPRPEATIISARNPIPAPSFGTSADEEEPEPQLSPRKPFPVAKPLAQHMIHAYSPARPSPLSRILQVRNSPAASVSGSEAEAAADAEEKSGTPKYTPLNQELKLEELIGAEDDSPLRNKGKRSLASKTIGQGVSTKTGTGTGTRRTSGEKSASKSAIRGTNRENGVGKATKPAAPSAVVKTGTRTLLSGKGGARRVPIGSADAAPIGPSWK